MVILYFGIGSVAVLVGWKCRGRAGYLVEFVGSRSNNGKQFQFLRGFEGTTRRNRNSESIAFLAVVTCRDSLCSIRHGGYLLEKHKISEKSIAKIKIKKFSED